MAGKEATIFVVDLGSSTGECHNGRVESDLDYGMRYVWDKITGIMLNNKSIGVVGFRTDKTDNALARDDDSYRNISILKELGPMQMSHLRDLQSNIQPNETDEADAVSAIVVAIKAMEDGTMLKTGKPGKFIRKIVLLTDGEGAIEDADIDPIAQKINDSEIELAIVGIDFDDAEYGFKEEDKSEVKRRNESILTSLANKCDGTIGTAAFAISCLDIPNVKTTRPYAPYKGRLSLGNFEKFPETSFYIDVERYSKTKAAKPVSASSFVSQGRTNGETQESSHTIQGDSSTPDDSGAGLAPIRNSKKYTIQDPEHPTGIKDVDFEELAKGYEYGRTAVHITESEQNITAFPTFKSFDIIGFIPNDKHQKFFNMGESCITVAMQANDRGKIALSSFVRALHELDSYAVARIVLKDDKNPQLLLLAPFIENEIEGLLDVPLPFAEDMRVYRFPPLDRVITTSGTVLTKHRNLPNDDLVDAMSAYVDSMDLSAFGKDEDGQPAEYMQIEETYNPLIHRLNQAIRRRAVHPNEPIPPPAEILIKYSNPPSELIADSAKELSALIKVADVKQVPPKAKGKRRREQAAPQSGLDIDKILGSQPKKQKISKNNSIADFKQMLSGGYETKLVAEAAKQMGIIIRDLIKGSTSNTNYGKALENMRIFRQEIIAFAEPSTYNDFLWDLKRLLLSDRLGQERREFLYDIQENKLGLINDEESGDSDLSRADASKFWSLTSEIPVRGRDA